MKKNILIVAATKNELQNLGKEIDTNFNVTNSLCKYNLPECTVSFLFTGIGIVNTIYNLSIFLHNKSFDMIINIGIAGSYNHNLALGQTCFIKTDQFADFLIESNSNNEKTALDIGLLLPEDISFESNTDIIKKHNDIPIVKSITSSIIHGFSDSIKKTKQLYPNTDIETMEGAAVMYCAQKQNIPCYQIRGISNYIEPRNKKNWKINLAINNYSNFIRNNILRK